MSAGKRVIGAVLIVVVVVLVVGTATTTTVAHAFAVRLGRVFFPRKKSKSTLASRHRWIPRKKKTNRKKGKQKREANKKNRGTKSKRLLDQNLNDFVCHRKNFGLALVVSGAAAAAATSSSSSASCCGCSWLKSHFCGLCCFPTASALFCCSFAILLAVLAVLPTDNFDCSLMVCTDFVAIFCYSSCNL